MPKQSRPGNDVPSILARIERPARAVVTAGMPYANGPLHLGHLAGAHLPADIHARWLGLLIGRDNVLYVCGTDDHGSTSEFKAMSEGKPVAEVIAEVHAQQAKTLARYSIGLDTYSGTSQPDLLGDHTELCGALLQKIYDNGMLEKRVTQQWYDPKVERFLPDRLVRGRCPNPKCDNDDAYADECSVCGHQHEPTELIEPRSAVSDATPELRDTAHLWLDMWRVSDVLKGWVETKKKTWRPVVYQQSIENLTPSLRFDREHEDAYKGFARELPKHKRKYAAGGQVVLQMASKADLAAARDALAGHSIDSELVDEWAKRPITRDTTWGVPMPDLDPDIAGKTLYVWPDSLIAPISFSRLALANSGRDPAEVDAFWRDPAARVYQFVGQDNVFFYVLMQGAMWLGSQDDPERMPEPGDLQMTDVIGCFHLMVGGEKMSKSRGNFLTGRELIDERGYDPDQIRYYLALLGLADKSSSFDLADLDERNAFLAGRMNSAFERPISAAHSKFGGAVPDGALIDRVDNDTSRMVQRYVKAMQRATYPSMLYELENYARKINSLFSKYKPHDDRHPEDARRDALYSSFYLLKNLMIMLRPFVPATMDRLRESLRLPPEVFSIDELGTPIPAGHELGPVGDYFPGTAADYKDG